MTDEVEAKRVTSCDVCGNSLTWRRKYHAKCPWCSGEVAEYEATKLTRSEVSRLGAMAVNKAKGWTNPPRHQTAIGYSKVVGNHRRFGTKPPKIGDRLN